MVNLYEVIRWGNDCDDVLTGGPDGLDTCFLVRADSPAAAASLADAQLAHMPAAHVGGFARAIYLLGQDAGSDAAPRVLRGPYLQQAYRYGWRQWLRDDAGGKWVESVR